jgi:hypothetical protein
MGGDQRENKKVVRRRGAAPKMLPAIPPGLLTPGQSDAASWQSQSEV